MSVKEISFKILIWFVVCLISCFIAVESLFGKFTAMAETDLSEETAETTAEGNEPSAIENIVAYDSEDFTVTEDYSAYVDAARLLHGTGGSANNILSANKVELYGGTVKAKTQLDSGKSGLLVTSNASGDDAVGKSFDIVGVQTGDFSLDFRVFSKETFRGYEKINSGAGNGGNGTTYEDEFNPFLDVRTVGITFTSATDADKAFTVYIDGAVNTWGTTTAARVAVKDEAYKWWGRSGYGVYDENGFSTYYNMSTIMENTSFSNVSRSAESFSNVIRFDVEKMCVYGRSYQFESIAGYGNGYSYKETDKLIRNLATNNYKDDNSGGSFSNDKLKTLSKEDFLFGYTVTVSIEDMTADGVEAAAPEADEAPGAESPYTNAVPSQTDTAGPYERFANIILYDINGQDMRRYEPFNVERKEYTFVAGKNTPSAGKKVEGFRLTSSVQNENAEGNSFDIDGSVFEQSDGTYMLAVSTISQQYAGAGGIKTLNGYDYGGLGNKNAAADPYSDVREIGITFRSKTDSEKAFTVYLSSSDLKLNAMSARVGVEGESYRNESGLKGFGLFNGTTFNGQDSGQTGMNLLATQTAGTMGMFNNTSNDSYNSAQNPYAWIKFDPQTMTVSTFDYNWKVVRDLSDNTRGVATDWLPGTLSPHIATLQQEDFSDFSVEITIERMNTAENRGLAMSEYTYYDNNGMRNTYTGGYADADGDGYILDAGYDRNAIVDIFAFSDTNVIEEEDVYFKNAEGYAEKSSFAFSGHQFTWEDTLTLGVQADADISMLTYSHLEKAETGTAVIEDGQITFSPENLGIYKFTGGGVDTYIILESAPPKLTLNTEAVKTIYVGDEFLVSQENLIIESNWQTDVKISCLFNGSPVELNGAVEAVQSGVYEIIYTVTDEGGKSAELKQTVTVLEKDTEPPLLLWNDMPSQILVSDSLDLKGIKASDAVDGNIQPDIVKVVLKSNGQETELAVADGIVVPMSEGEIFISVEAVDSMGNKTEKTYRVAVNAVEQDIIDSEHNETENSGGDIGVPDENNGNAGLIIGLSIGGGMIVLTAGIVAWYAVRKKRNKKEK